MTDKIVPLHSDRPHSASFSEPDADIVEFLEDLLARARGGEVRCISVAASGSAGWYKLKYLCADEVTFGHLIALTSRLWYQVLRDDHDGRDAP